MRPRMRLRISRVRMAALGSLFALVSTMAVGLTGIQPANATCYTCEQPFGTTLQGAGAWLQGAGVVSKGGVDVYANYDTSSVYPSQINNVVPSASGYVGTPWQCVELTQRLYQAKGWHTGFWSGVDSAYQIYDNAAANNLQAHANNGSYKPVPGDMIIHSPGTGSTSGHVAIVDSVTSTTITALEQNVASVADNNGVATYSVDSNGVLARSSISLAIRGIVHSPNNPNTNTAPPPPPALPNVDTIRLQADFTGDGKADVAVVTPRASGNPSGVNISMLQSSGSALSNIGLWFYDSGVDIYTSRYVTGDFTGDGKADLAAITPRGGGGINVTLLASTGSGFTYSGLWYYDTGIDPGSTKYLAGDFAGDGKMDIATITSRGHSGTSGVNVSVLQNTGSSFTSLGLWYYNDGVDISAKWVQGNFTGNVNGKTDVAVVTPRGGGGVNLSTFQSTGTAFNNIGLWFYDTGVDPTSSRFIPGDFTGDGKTDIAVITARSYSTPSGINLSMLQDTGGTFSNIGLWFYDTGVDISNSRYIPGDFSGDGKADLAAITPRGSIGVNLSMLQSSGTALNNVGLWWYDNGVYINISHWM
jgi:hypothetical protein